MRTSYRVVVTREGDHWLADVPELQGAHTFAGTLRRLDQMVREVIVLAADLPDEAMDGLALDYDYHLGDEEMDDRVNALRRARRELNRVQLRVGALTEEVVTELAPRARLSQRDTAELAGLSFQRVSQLQGRARSESG